MVEISLRDLRTIREYIGAKDVLLGFYNKNHSDFKTIHINRQLILGTAAEFPRIREMARPGGVLETKIDNFITNIRSDVGTLRREFVEAKDRLGGVESAIFSLRTTINAIPTTIDNRIKALGIPNLDTVRGLIDSRISGIIQRTNGNIRIVTPIGTFEIPTLTSLKDRIIEGITIAKNYVECIQTRLFDKFQAAVDRAGDTIRRAADIPNQIATRLGTVATAFTNFIADISQFNPGDLLAKVQASLSSGFVFSQQTVGTFKWGRGLFGVAITEFDQTITYPAGRGLSGIISGFINAQKQILHMISRINNDAGAIALASNFSVVSDAMGRVGGMAFGHIENWIHVLVGAILQRFHDLFNRIQGRIGDSRDQLAALPGEIKMRAQGVFDLTRDLGNPAAFLKPKCTFGGSIGGTPVEPGPGPSPTGGLEQRVLTVVRKGPTVQ